MPTLDEMDVIIADLVAVLDRLQAVRAKQIMQNATVIPFPPQLRVEACCGEQGQCAGCPEREPA